MAVVFGVRGDELLSSFDVREEGVRPAVLMEVTSPATVSIDLIDKVQHYARARVPLYVIIDVARRRKERIPRLLGYRLVDNTYELFNADDPDQVWLEPLRVSLRLVDGELAIFDEQGVRLPG